MSEEVKLLESVKKTQDLLGKYIKKPPLTEKLLKKPPFRFLHDIITAVIKETGFLKSLFTEEESDSSNVKDKEAKLVYLNKLIDAVKLITGNELSVRASKIISGQEPIRTNELLQAIGRALDKKISSTEAVEYYKKSLEKKESLKNKNEKKNSEEKEVKSVKKKSSSESKTSSEKKTRSRDDKAKGDVKTESKETKNSGVNVEKQDGKRTTKKKESTDGSKRRSSQASNEKRVKSNEKTKKSSVTAFNEVVEAETKKVPESVNTFEDQVTEEHSESPDQGNPNEFVIEKVTEVPVGDVTARELETKVAQVDKGEEKQEKPNDNVTAGISATGLLRPPSARPPSARPAAPRVRGKPDFILNNGIMNQLGDVGVIVENFDAKNNAESNENDEDDADEMVVVETSSPNDPIPVDSGGADLLNSQLAQEHGYLVAQILDTQREIVNESNVELIPNKVEIEWEAGLKKDRDVIVKEVDKLRGTIQSLTRATNPLGKLLDFLQEDAEIMEKELRDWRNQFNGIREKLIVEKNMTVEALKPLNESLKEVQDLIEDQTEKIFQARANIMKNDQRIQKLFNKN